MFVYRLTNTVNGKSYVGQTTASVALRLRQHQRSAGYARSRQRYIIARAIAKHGWQSFTTEVLEECTSQEQLDERERFWIAQYNCVAPHGYNADKGGRGKGRVSEATKRKIGDAHRGKQVSAETRARITASKTGILYGPASAEKRAKIGRANAGDRSGSAKLSWGQVEAIRCRYASGEAIQKELALEYGITQGVVSLIVRNRIWVQSASPDSMMGS